MHHRSLVRYAAAAALCVAGAFLSQATLAGTKFTSTVSILPASQFGPASASGSIGSARNSADSVQQFGCQTWFDGTANGAICSARNAAGTVLTCSTTSPDFIARIRTINSQTSFTFTESSGGCAGFMIGAVSRNDVPVN